MPRVNEAERVQAWVAANLNPEELCDDRRLLLEPLAVFRTALNWRSTAALRRREEPGPPLESSGCLLALSEDHLLLLLRISLPDDRREELPLDLETLPPCPESSPSPPRCRKHCSILALRGAAHQTSPATFCYACCKLMLKMMLP